MMLLRLMNASAMSRAQRDDRWRSSMFRQAGNHLRPVGKLMPLWRNEGHILCRIEDFLPPVFTDGTVVTEMRAN